MIFIFDDTKEPEDIFAETGTDNASSGTPPPNLPTPGAASPLPATGAAKPKDPSKGTTPLPVGESGVIVEKSAFSKKLVFAAVVVGVILIGLGVWYFLIYDKGASLDVNQEDFTSPTADQDSGVSPVPPLPDGTAPTAGTPTEEDDVSSPPTDDAQPLEGESGDEIQDSDNDGLTDAEEASFGTDPQDPDTDGDGLSDREEVRTYDTDPLNPDTDGDTFSDGSEVQNGYDPNGPGRLLQIPQ